MTTASKSIDTMISTETLLRMVEAMRDAPAGTFGAYCYERGVAALAARGIRA